MQYLEMGAQAALFLIGFVGALAAVALILWVVLIIGVVVGDRLRR